MKKFLSRSLLALAAAVSLCGCTTFRQTQEVAFADYDTETEAVDGPLMLYARYGELSRKYEYPLVSPVNGHTVYNTDKRIAKVQLPAPNNKWIDCYICQNSFPKGTMYGTRDGKWKFLTTGVACRLYLINEDGTDYLLVFQGKSCDFDGTPLGGSLL